MSQKSSAPPARVPSEKLARDIRRAAHKHHSAQDKNIGADASYRAGGTGAPVLLRVVRSAPDRLGDAFGTSVIQASDVLTVAIAVLPAVDADDTFTLGPDTLTVQHAERDATGIAWRVFCRR